MPIKPFLYLTATSILGALPLLCQGATYQHPSGASFIYPDSWQAAPMAENVLVAPKSAPKDTQGVPHELVLLGAEGIGELTNLADANVVAFFDEGATALLPGASRSAAPQLADDHAELSYSDSSGGKLTVRYRFESGLGLYAAHRTVQGAVANERTARAIFSSFAISLATDPDLIGVWSRSTTEASDISYGADGGASYVSSNARVTYEFTDDQRVRLYSRSSVYGQAESSGGSTTVSSAGANEPDIGTYTVQGDTLTILWTEGDAVSYTYRVFATSDGPALKLVHGDSKPRFFRPL